MSDKPTSINPENIHNNMLNNSVSKMLYSFSKTKRFSQRLHTDVPYYTIPNLSTKRTTTFGFGQKSKFEDTRGFPSPDKYNVTK